MQDSSCDPQDDGATRKVFKFHTDETINKKVIYMIYFETKYVHTSYQSLPFRKPSSLFCLSH